MVKLQINVSKFRWHKRKKAIPFFPLLFSFFYFSSRSFHCAAAVDVAAVSTICFDAGSTVIGVSADSVVIVVGH